MVSTRILLWGTAQLLIYVLGVDEWYIEDALDEALNTGDIIRVAKEEQMKPDWGNIGYFLAIMDAPSREVREKFQKQAFTLLDPEYLKYKERLSKLKEGTYQCPEDIKQAVLKTLVKK